MPFLNAGESHYSLPNCVCISVDMCVCVCGVGRGEGDVFYFWLLQALIHFARSCFSVFEYCNDDCLHVVSLVI